MAAIKKEVRNMSTWDNFPLLRTLYMREITATVALEYREESIGRRGECKKMSEIALVREMREGEK